MSILRCSACANATAPCSACLTRLVGAQSALNRTATYNAPYVGSEPVRCQQCGLLLTACQCAAARQVRPVDFKPRAVANEFEAVPEIVKLCEMLLADAQSGKLRGIAVGMVMHDDLAPAGEVGWNFHAALGAVYALGESISRLRHAWDKDRDG